MALIRTAVVVVVLIFMIHVVHFAAVSVLEPVKDQVVYDGDTTDLYDKRAIADDIFEVMTKWSVVILDAGVMLWGMVRVYRTQRDTAITPRGARP